MSEKQVKRQLREMLEGLTPGSILHVLAEVFGEEAENARLAEDAVIYRRCRNVEHALFVVGLGVDSACPR